MYQAKKNTIYGNCSVLSPEGILMFKCNEKKMNWYLNRNLATIVNNNPPTIQLNFIPNGLGNHNKSYGLGKMENICVNCGTPHQLTRHHIVPFCYRKYFPMDLKSHNFHDVLPMCIPCHNNYEREADNLKQEIAKKYNSPINGVVIEDKILYSYFKMVITLLRKDIIIPKHRVKEMRNNIKQYFNIKRLTTARLKKLSEIEFRKLISTHGEVVINQIEDIQEFIEMWRKHFIKNNECKFLPENWSINTK